MAEECFLHKFVCQGLSHTCLGHLEQLCSVVHQRLNATGCQRTQRPKQVQGGFACEGSLRVAEIDCWGACYERQVQGGLRPEGLPKSCLQQALSI